MSEMLLETLPAGFRKLESMVQGLARLLMQRNLFPETHPSVRNALGHFMEALETLIDKRSSVLLRVSEGSIRLLNFEVDIIDTNDNAVHFLRRALDGLSIGEIEFFAGITPDEALAFVEIAAASVRRDTSLDLPAKWRRIERIRIRHSGDRRDDAVVKEALPAETKAAVERDPDVGISGEMSAASRLISTVLGRLGKISSNESGRAGKAIIETVEREGCSSTTILLLKSLKEYDDYTFDHSINVAVISAAIASRMGYSDEETGRIGTAAIMHDIGKLYVPREIIHKEGRLSPVEWQKVKRHPVDGERILREEGMDILTRRVAYEHHMRFDMKGYPMPKKGEKCLEASDIVRIADTYDALTTKRPYRKQISPFEALKLMAGGRGTEFHPEYFDLFLGVMGNVPIGSVLVLDSGERVVVVEIGADGRLPRARIVSDSYGNEIKDGPVIDLGETDAETGEAKYRVNSVSDSPVRDVDIGKYITGGSG
jgi:putative nucleotidyltransferase with HDIG domain